MSQHGVNDLLKDEPTLDTLGLSKAQKHALYTLIASKAPEKYEFENLSPQDAKQAGFYNRGLQDYDNAIKELLK